MMTVEEYDDFSSNYYRRPGGRTRRRDAVIFAANVYADAVAAAPPPETFTVGVTDVLFNPINAVFGRLLKTPGGHTVTLAYWRQQENEPDDEKPYFEGR